MLHVISLYVIYDIFRLYPCVWFMTCFALCDDIIYVYLMNWCYHCFVCLYMSSSMGFMVPPKGFCLLTRLFRSIIQSNRSMDNTQTYIGPTTPHHFLCFVVVFALSYYLLVFAFDGWSIHWAFKRRAKRLMIRTLGVFPSVRSIFPL